MSAFVATRTAPPAPKKANPTLKRTSQGADHHPPAKKQATEPKATEKAPKTLVEEFATAIQLDPDHLPRIGVQEVVDSVAKMDANDMLTAKLIDLYDILIAHYEDKPTKASLCTIRDALAQRVLECEAFLGMDGTMQMIPYLDWDHVTLGNIALTRTKENLKHLSKDLTVKLLEFMLERFDNSLVGINVEMDQQLQFLAAIIETESVDDYTKYIPAICALLQGQPNFRALQIVAFVFSKLSATDLIEAGAFQKLICPAVQRAWGLDFDFSHLFGLIQEADFKISREDPSVVPKCAVQILKLFAGQLSYDPGCVAYCKDVIERVSLEAKHGRNELRDELRNELRQFIRTAILDAKSAEKRGIFMDLFTELLRAVPWDYHSIWQDVLYLANNTDHTAISFQFGIFLTTMINEASKHTPTPTSATPATPASPASSDASHSLVLADFQSGIINLMPDLPLFARPVHAMERELCLAIEGMLSLPSAEVTDEMLEFVCATLRSATSHRTHSTHSHGTNEIPGRMLEVLAELTEVSEVFEVSIHSDRQFDRSACLNVLREVIQFFVATNAHPILLGCALDVLSNLITGMAEKEAGTLILELFKILLDVAPGINTQALIEFIAEYIPHCLYRQDLIANLIPQHIALMASCDAVNVESLMQAARNVRVEEPLPDAAFRRVKAGVHAHNPRSQFCRAKRV